MPISRLPFAAAVLLALAGCDPSRVGGLPSRAMVTVGGEEVAIAPPPGFCIDHASTTTGEAGAFVLVGDCALLGGRPQGEPVGAVLTASVAHDLVLPEGDGGLEELAEFLASGEGRAVLGRSGDPARTRALASRVSGDVLYVLVEDRGAQPVAGVEPEFWRAFLDLRGRLVALTVQGFRGSGIDRQEGIDLVAAFVAATRAANRSR